jgi:hypothetical protein
MQREAGGSELAGDEARDRQPVPCAGTDAARIGSQEARRGGVLRLGLRVRVRGHALLLAGGLLAGGVPEEFLNVRAAPVDPS